MLTLAARYVFPVEGAPIPDGRVSIVDGRIVRVFGLGEDGPAADLDLGNAAITPGFVNAHTHLDLGPISPPPLGGTEDEVAWLRRVVDARRGGLPRARVGRRPGGTSRNASGWARPWSPTPPRAARAGRPWPRPPCGGWSTTS